MGYIVGGVLLLVFFILLSLQLQPVQNFLKDEALGIYREKVDTRVELERLSVNFPSNLILENLYLEDQDNDTLAYIKKLRVDANMWKLLSGELPISSIELSGFVGKLHVNPQDTTFNFNHILTAFAADSTAAQQDTTTVSQDTTTTQSSSGLDIDIDAVHIDNSRFYFDDTTSGFRMMYGIGNFDVELREFDLNKMIFHISDISLSNSSGMFVQTADVPSTEEESEQVEIDFAVDEVAIEQVKFLFESIPGEIKVLTDVGSLTGNLKEIDINTMDYIAEELHLSNTLVDVDIYGASSDTTELEETTESDTIILNTAADRITFSNLTVQFDDHTAAETSGFDPLHFNFSDLDAVFEDIRYRLENEDSYAFGTVKKLNTQEGPDMTLSRFNGRIEFTPTYTLANNIDLKAGRTSISGDFRLSYSSLEALSEDLQNIGIKADVAPSNVHLNDVAYFVPDLKTQINELPSTARNLNFEGELQGKLSAMDIRYFQLRGLRNTQLNVRGYIGGMPDVNDLYTNLSITKLHTTKTDIKAFVADTLLPENITIPEQIDVKGKIAGRLDDLETDLALNTSLGGANVKASIALNEDSVYTYTGDLQINEFDVGQLLQQPEMYGKLSLNINADGKGFTLDELNTKIQGEIESFRYNNYTYNDLKVNGELFKQEFSGDLAMDDNNLDFTFEGTVDLNDSIPAFMFYLQVDTANLKALNFSDEEFLISGDIDSDLRARNFEQIKGHVGLEDFVIHKGDETYNLDSLMFRSEEVNGENRLTIESDILQGKFQGDFSIVQLPQVIQAHINRYYQLLDTTSIEGIASQSFTFNLDILQTDLITGLVPGLEELRPGTIEGSYNSKDWTMDILVRMYTIDYAGTVLDTLEVNITSDEEALTYEAELEALRTGGFAINNILFEGRMAYDHINTALHIQNEEGVDKFLFGGIFTTWEEQYYQLQLTPGRVIMDYEDWEVYPGNAIRFFPSGFIMEDLRLSNNEQELEAETRINDEQDTLLSLGFQRFQLSTFNSLAEIDTTLIGGLLNGNMKINTSAETFAFTSNLSIRHLAYEKDTLGDLSVNAYTTEQDQYNITANLDGRGNNFLFEGYYQADSVAQNINFDVDMESLDFKVIEAFAMGELSQSRGYLTGDVDIRGTVSNPDIKGEIGFRDVVTNVTFSNTWLIVNDEQIDLDLEGLHFNDFVINDGSRNDLVIDGDIFTESYSSFRFDLEARMRDFLLMNTGAGDNPLVYGTLVADSDISLEGTTALPIIDMSITLDDESRVTYIVPESEISNIDREGLIKIVDRSSPSLSKDDNLSESEEYVQDTVQSALQGINFTANIDVDRGNKFTVVIDPATGDRLNELQGEGNLSLNVNPTGEISMNGRYTVYDGSYIMRFFGLARREFSIVEGSYILWTGEPLNARIDMRAQYDVLASPKPLFNNVATVGNDFYAKRTFLVFLDIDGRLLSPELSFELDMPQDETRGGVMARLQEINQQESRLLEEVLSLVVFRRFSGGNILAGGGGGGAEGTARQSVSRVLSQQLNQLGSQVEGVDLTFDVQSYQDYSQTGQVNRTQVELGVSKQFFDDRVRVNISGNFDVEGERRRQQQDISDFAGDIEVEYLITEDGQFRLVGFRKNEFDDLLQGEIIETGVGVVFVKDYNSLSELFTGMKKKRSE